MNKQLKELEKKAYRSVQEDGFWDMYLGLLMLGIFIPKIVEEMGFRDLQLMPDLSVYSLLVYAAAIAILLIGKRFITVPRLGRVRFGEKRKRRLAVMAICLTISFVGGLVMFFLTVKGWIIIKPGSALDVPTLMFGGMQFLFAILAAYLLGFPRLYAYAFIFGLAFPLARYFTRSGLLHFGYTLTGGLGGLIMLLVGLYLLARFMKRYEKAPLTV